MPYHIGKENSNGCSGFPVVDDTGKTVGCHPTKEKAVNHMQALYANVSDAKKSYEGCGCPTCKELNVNCENCPVCQANETKSECCPDLNKQAPCWEGYVQRGMKPGKNGKMVPNCVPVQKSWFNFKNLKPERNQYRIGK